MYSVTIKGTFPDGAKRIGIVAHSWNNKSLPFNTIATNEIQDSTAPAKITSGILAVKFRVTEAEKFEKAGFGAGELGLRILHSSLAKALGVELEEVFIAALYLNQMARCVANCWIDQERVLESYVNAEYTSMTSDAKFEPRSRFDAVAFKRHMETEACVNNVPFTLLGAEISGGPQTPGTNGATAVMFSYPVLIFAMGMQFLLSW